MHRHLDSSAPYFSCVWAAGTNVMGAMYKGFIVTAVTSIPLIWFVTQYALGTGGHGHGHDHQPGFRAWSNSHRQLAVLLAFARLWSSPADHLDHRILHRTKFRPVRSIAKARNRPRQQRHSGSGRSALNRPRCRRMVIAAGIIIAFQLRLVSWALPMRPTAIAGAWRHGSWRSTPYGPVTDMPAVSPKCAGLA